MLWVLAFHIIFMVTWFAGLFYLPRLFIYHNDASEEPARARFATMERRLYIIMTIGAAGTIGCGIALVVLWFWPLPGWLIGKLVLVAGLVAYHGYCRRMMARLAAGGHPHSTRFLRLFNEVPAFFLMFIVILAVVKPF